MDRRTVLTIGMAMLVALAGCAGGGDGAGEPAEATQTPSGAAPQTTAQEDVGLDPASQADVQTQRYRIKRATYTLEVADFDTARSQLRSAVRGAGGYVGSENFRTRERRNVSWRTGTIVLRPGRGVRTPHP